MASPSALSTCCRVFPSTVAGWSSVLHTALSVPFSQLKSPPHLQAYCIDVKNNAVIENMNYSSMLTYGPKGSPAPSRRSGVLCLLEPVILKTCHHYRHDLKNDGQNKNHLQQHLPFELRSYLTLRHSRMNTHKGEMAYPGGRCDGAESPQEAAIREGTEEIGADPSRYDVQGVLSRVYSFPSKSFVVPAVALAKKMSAEPALCVRHSHESTEIRQLKETEIESKRAHQTWVPNPPPNPPRDPASGEERIVDFARVTNPTSTLGLSVTSPGEVEAIESADLLHLLLDSEGHKFVDRSWRSIATGHEQRWLLPAFDTSENHQIIWGLTAFIFCELLCRLAHALQQLPLPDNATVFEREVYDRLHTFHCRASDFYVRAKDPEGVLKVKGLPPANVAVDFANPYEDIPE